MLLQLDVHSRQNLILERDGWQNQGDSLEYNGGHHFTTKDRDNDVWSGNCAKNREGAWWFNSCSYAHLNGKYYPDGHAGAGQGIQYRQWKGSYDSLKKCSMKMRKSAM